jgi:hypothetical protein
MPIRVKTKVMTLAANEFTRRFLLHALREGPPHPSPAAENNKKSRLFRPGQVTDHIAKTRLFGRVLTGSKAAWKEQLRRGE